MPRLAGPRRRSAAAAAALVPVVLLAAGCAPKDSGSGASSSSGSDSPASCATGDLVLKQSGRLTVGTDTPAYPPWFVDDKPSNGKGYESAVTYAVAKQLGLSASKVDFVKVPFNNSYAPGAKSFDFDINQISITPARAKVVSFSRGYYTATQAVIALKGTAAAKATSLADLAKLRLGAQTGTTSLTAVREQVKPSAEPRPFDDTNEASQALQNKQVDAIVADLPTAFELTATAIDDGTILGQFKSTGTPEQFGLLSQKGSALTPCLDKALDALDSAGTLAALEKKWLSQTVSVPVLEP